jgi:hypothetical protein
MCYFQIKKKCMIWRQKISGLLMRRYRYCIDNSRRHLKMVLTKTIPYAVLTNATVMSPRRPVHLAPKKTANEASVRRPFQSGSVSYSWYTVQTQVVKLLPLHIYCISPYLYLYFTGTRKQFIKRNIYIYIYIKVHYRIFYCTLKSTKH